MPRRTGRELRPEGTRGHGRRRALPRVAEVDEIAGRIVGPAWATVAGYRVGNVAGTKRYRCPWCEGWIEPGIAHVVAFEIGKAEERRHYHSGCWARQLQAWSRRTR